MIILETLKAVIDNFGSAIVVPFIIFIIALIFRVKPAKAFLSGLYAGVSLEGFTLIIGAYTPIITPLVQNMSDVMSNITGVHLNTFDVGWQATSVVAFATSAGMIYLGLGIALQTILFLVKWTNIFQPSDLWNNYSYIVWGAMVIFSTHNFALGIACMILLNLYSLLISELVAKRWSKYYNYPNCTIIAMHNVEPAIFAIDPILNKLGLNKVKLNPKSIEKKLGFIGEPMTLGFILGALIGILGSIDKLGTLAGWGDVLEAAIATAAIMAIFPKIASMFAQAFAPITEAARVFMGKSGDREWYIAVNDAVGYGEPATLTSGLLLIPIMVIIATILPGNQVLPVVDLLAIPYMVQGLVAVYKGNMSKILVAGIIWFSLGLLMCTYTAPLFTEVARSAGFAIPAGAAMITSFNILGKPMLGFVFLAFLSGNPLFIGIAVAVYAVAFIIFKTKNQQIVEYLDRQADKNDTATEQQGV
nr:PTS transporter subunit IIC [uncultured Anaerostipes sp.]